MAASIHVNDYWVNQNQIPTLGDVEDGIEQCTITGIDQTNMAGGATVVTISDSAPTATNGVGWMDTSTLAGAPEVRPRVYNAASTEWLGWNILYSATEPATLTTGWLWYDMTAKLLRVYRAATYDPNGIAGWHPVSEQYQLWKNKSGGIIAPNQVVVNYTAASGRGFTTATVEKTQQVIGVTLATIASDAYGLVATVMGGANVSVACIVTPGNIAIGDGIVHSATAGSGRTVGALPTSANPSAAVQHTGTPLGCFAVALEAVTTATITKCRLLGRIGDGATYRKTSTTVAAFADGLANANWDGGWDAVDLSNYPPGAGGSDYIADAKHKPIAGVYLAVDAAMTSDAPATTIALNLNLGPDASTAMENVHMDASTDTNVSRGMQTNLFCVTAASSGNATALGQVFYWAGTKSANAGTAAVTAANFRAQAYLY